MDVMVMLDQMVIFVNCCPLIEKTPGKVWSRKLLPLPGPLDHGCIPPLPHTTC